MALRDGERLQVCQTLRRVTGHEFSGYKTSTIGRHLRQRMQRRGVGISGNT